MGILFGKNQSQTPAQVLDAKHLKNCKVVPLRFHLLANLTKDGVGAEVGVLGGDWSERLIRFTNPKKLVLIDTYKSNDYSHQNRFTKSSHFSIFY